MTEPTQPPTSINDPIWGVRGQPSGTLGAVNHIQRAVDIGVYLQWLKSIDNQLATSIFGLASTVAADEATVASLSSSVSSLASAISAAATTLANQQAWYSWSGPIVYATGGGFSLGTGGSTVAYYKHQGYDVICDFVVTMGTGGSEGTGFHRINLPVAADPFYAANQGLLGYGHVHSGDAQLFSGLGPGSIVGVQFHTAPALTNLQAGIIMPGNPQVDKVPSGALTFADNFTAGANPFTEYGGVQAGDKYVGKLVYKSAVAA